VLTRIKIIFRFLGRLDYFLQSIDFIKTQLTTQRSLLVSIHDDLQSIIQQAQVNHDVELSATQAIHSLLDRLDEQVSQGDLDAIRQTVATMRESAGSLGQAIAATGQQDGQSGQQPSEQTSGEPSSPGEPASGPVSEPLESEEEHR
jgi:BMFP domain-containing protein YqiC